MAIQQVERNAVGRESVMWHGREHLSEQVGGLRQTIEGQAACASNDKLLGATGADHIENPAKNDIAERATRSVCARR